VFLMEFIFWHLILNAGIFSEFVIFIDKSYHMVKTLLLFILGMLCIQTVRAQNTNGVKNSGYKDGNAANTALYHPESKDVEIIDPISITDTNRIVDPNQVYAAVEVEPHFKGGAAAFNTFLASNVKFPAVDRINGTQGKVIVTFVVEKDGSLSDVKALRSPSQSMADAAVTAIQQSPKWVPGIQNGRPVRVQYTISFAFSLADK
jgi:TonB family protein